MADPRFRPAPTPGQTLDAFEVAADDPEFLRPREFTFLFFTPSLPRLRLLHGKYENYQQGAIQFAETSVSATEVMGRPCVHCKQPVSSASDCCVAVNNGSIVATVHETCFKDWFGASDKGQLSPYRLVRAHRRKLVISGGSFKLQINDGAGVEEYTFTGLEPVKIDELARETNLHGTIVQGGASGFSGTPPQGMAPEDYMACMSTMVQAGAPAPRPEPDASRPAPWPLPGEAASGAGQAPAPVSTYRTEVQCPHCQHTLVVTIQSKGS